jgi:hypothetical protein
MQQHLKKILTEAWYGFRATRSLGLLLDHGDEYTSSLVQLAASASEHHDAPHE